MVSWLSLKMVSWLPNLGTRMTVAVMALVVASTATSAESSTMHAFGEQQHHALRSGLRGASEVFRDLIQERIVEVRERVTPFVTTWTELSDASAGGKSRPPIGACAGLGAGLSIYHSVWDASSWAASPIARSEGLTTLGDGKWD